MLINFANAISLANVFQLGQIKSIDIQHLLIQYKLKQNNNLIL